MIQYFKFNKSYRIFMQKSVDQRPFDFFFSFGTENQFAIIDLFNCLSKSTEDRQKINN